MSTISDTSCSVVNPHFAFLLSAYDRSPLHPDHLADLRQSGLTDETIVRQKIRSVPPALFDDLLRFRAPAAVRSTYVIPFFTVDGTLTDHIRVKVFPAFRNPRGQVVKYLQPRASGMRIYFPLAALEAVHQSRPPLYLVEGEKKSLAVAQLGLPAVGISGVEGWHVAASRWLHPDLASVPITGRIVRVVADGDAASNLHVARAVRRLSDALRAAGAWPLVVRLPEAA